MSELMVDDLILTEKCSQEVWSNLSILSISPVWFGQSFSKS